MSSRNSVGRPAKRENSCRGSIISNVRIGKQQLTMDKRSHVTIDDRAVLMEAGGGEETSLRGCNKILLLALRIEFN